MSLAVRGSSGPRSFFPVPVLLAAFLGLLGAGGCGAPDGNGAGAATAHDLSRREAIRTFWEAFRKGEAARLSGDPARLGEAEAAYRDALAVDPAHENARWGLANVLEAQGRRGEAVEALRALLDAHPRSPRAHAHLGEILMTAGEGAPADPGGAEAAFRAALALNPEESGAHVNLGRLLYAVGRSEEAEGSFRAALKINFKSLAAARFLALLSLEREGAAAALAEIVPVLERFLADKPRLEALSEGDTLESEGETRLTAAARELMPALLLAWTIAADGPFPEDPLPPAVRAAASDPLPVSPRRLRPSGPPPGGDPPREVLADLDGDGIGDRFRAGSADAAEAAAWILTRHVLCGPRSSTFERGRPGGGFDPVEPHAGPRACLPAGSLRLERDARTGAERLILEAWSAEPGRVEPDILIAPAPGAGPWRFEVAGRRR